MAKFRGGSPKGRLENAPLLLSSMRFVLKEDGPDDTRLKKICRDLLNKDPDRFIARLERLETAWLARRTAAIGKKVEAKPDAPIVIDEGAERVQEAIRRILQEARGAVDERPRADSHKVEQDLGHEVDLLG